MDFVVNILAGADNELLRPLTGAFLLLLVPTVLFFAARARAMLKAGKPFPLRPIEAFTTLNKAMDAAAESGRPVHVSLGTGGIGDVTTAESMAALTLLDQLAHKAVLYDAHPLVTTADPTLLLAAQDRLRQAYVKGDFVAGYDASNVRLVAPDRTAYAAGTMALLRSEPLSGNVMLGAFGDEYLLIGETGARKYPTQVAGATDPSVLPFVLATTDRPLLGEEIFTAGAYLGNLPAHVGSLFAQDWARVLLILVIIIGVVVKTLL